MSQPVTSFPNTGKTIRMGRILDPKTGRAAVIAFDHGLHLGPQPGILNPGSTLELLTDAGADAFSFRPVLREHSPASSPDGARRG